MTKTSNFNLDDFKPKYLDQDRWNNWYFVVHFTHEEKDYTLKLAVAEGTLPLAKKVMSFSRDPLSFTQEADVRVLNSPINDINVVIDEEQEIEFKETKNEVIVEMGDLMAICKPDEQRIISKNEKLKADLTFTPRGPIFYWGEEKGATCIVTEATRTAGIESLSNVKGMISFEGKEIKIESRGIFERVWINELNLFEIRVMNWIYANFEQLYMYICHSESVTMDSTPFHFETGKVYLMPENDYLFTKKLEITPENWVYLKEFRQFIPFEQKVEVKTDKGNLKLKVTPINYPQFFQAMRLEHLVIDNIPGWNSLFYDIPVKIQGKFVSKDKKTIELINGQGMNEVIRLGPL
ncbi:MAG: hypothetical protein ACFFC7_17335 [Candidatus Hermodarchaeota archaeon]